MRNDDSKSENVRTTAGASTLCRATRTRRLFYLPPANEREKHHRPSPAFCRRDRKKRRGNNGAEKWSGRGAARLAKGSLRYFTFQSSSFKKINNVLDRSKHLVVVKQPHVPVNQNIVRFGLATIPFHPTVPRERYGVVARPDRVPGSAAALALKRRRERAGIVLRAICVLCFLL